MTNTEEVEKFVSGFSRLSNGNKQYIIGITEALSFAQAKLTEREKEISEIKRIPEVESWR